MLNSITTKLTQKAFDLTPQHWRHLVRDILPLQLVRNIKALVSEQQLVRYQDTANPAIQLEIRLWGGFANQALKDLKHLQTSTEDGQTRLLASWALARWEWAQGEYGSAYQHLQIARGTRSLKKLEQGLLLLESDCLVQLKQYDKARKLLKNATQRRVKNAHILLALANTYAAEPHENDEKRLALSNQVLGKKKLTTISKRQPERPLGLNNLSTAHCKAKILPPNQPLITVIMPAYKAELTLAFALDSLLAQSWENIEIIIVDDCSPDATYEIAQRYASKDQRIKALQLSHNQGAYSCRNYGLRQANGIFVTTHDADDWSHPQKLEVQATHLIKHPKSKANITDWVRALPNLLFRGTSRPSERMVQMNHSSLMLRRELLNSMGGWDNVRIAADTELIWRLEKFPGGSKPARLLTGIPLSFALEDPGSLTRFSDTHVRTIYYGTRHQYRTAAKFWHTESEPAALKLPPAGDQRAFPAPGNMLAEQQTTVYYDVIHIMDFNKQGAVLECVYDEILSDIQNNLNTALFHWPSYQSDTFSHLLPTAFQRLIHTGKVAAITFGITASTRQLKIWNEETLNYPIDPRPKFNSRELLFNGKTRELENSPKAKNLLFNGTTNLYQA